jgi:adenylate cyclase
MSQGAGAQRQLAAIAFIDIVGYSILMADDEAKTHARWMTLLESVVRPLAVEHHCRLLKSTGDGVLAAFPSAFDAVTWARAVQIAAAPHAETAEQPGISLRISVHVGDVIEAAGDVHGNGVNVAARLQEHAEPGAIVLSEAVHDLIRSRLAIPMRDLGLLRLKNFEHPLRAYSIDPERSHSGVPVRPGLGPLPSIAVLPLKNLSGDQADDYFARGIVEDIIVSLAGLRELLVIARTSTATDRLQDSDVREVGRALGVRYVMTGAVRRSPRQIRVSVHLCDARTGGSLWSDTSEMTPGELFDVQDRIVGRIVAGIAPQVRSEELRRALRKRPENFTAYDHMLQALDILANLQRKTFPQAREFLKNSMREDASFAMPVAWAARWHSINIGQGWTRDLQRDVEQAAWLAARAIELDPDNAVALSTYGHLRSRWFQDFDAAMFYFDRALTACPNSALAWTLSALTLAYVGQSEKAIEHAEHGLRLSPLGKGVFFYYTNLGWAHYAAGNYVEAAKWTRMAAAENPMFTANLRLLCAALAALGRIDEATDVAKTMMRLDRNFTLAHYEQTLQPFRDADIKSRFIDHLRRTGLRD